MNSIMSVAAKIQIQQDHCHVVIALFDTAFVDAIRKRNIGITLCTLKSQSA